MYNKRHSSKVRLSLGPVEIQFVFCVSVHTVVLKDIMSLLIQCHMLGG